VGAAEHPDTAREGLIVEILILILWALASARITRLLIRDEITDFIRVWVFRRWSPQSKAGYFATCPWCVGMWLALATAPYVVWINGWSWWLYPIVAFAGSYTTGILAERVESDEDIEVEIVD
jgi:hypothetical protein